VQERKLQEECKTDATATEVAAYAVKAAVGAEAVEAVAFAAALAAEADVSDNSLERRRHGKMW